MAGIYIHIPFCKKACHYCNFHFSTSANLVESFVTALLEEIELQKIYLAEPVSTIYFGGGTPSILPAEKIKKILSALQQHYTIDIDAEITLEANPDDIDLQKLEQWNLAGINRLSIGVQSFFEEDLLWMNRSHTAFQAKECIELAQSAGFQNLTIDLIYGTPTLSDEQWQQNVAEAIALGVAHLSCYALTVEPATALETMIRQKKMIPVDVEKQARHFELLMTWLQTAGFEHYEISNFAKPGFRSRHNSSYWQSKPYLGLGPSAHSFNGKSRQWNVANNALYIQSLNKKIVPFEIEILSTEQQVNEYIMTALRTMEGISLRKIEDEFGATVLSKILAGAQKHIAAFHLQKEKETITTTNAGKLLADGIAADLFV